MIVAINQPAYLPWLGYFHRIIASDIYVVLDHVQFEKNSFTNRNKIRTQDSSLMLTVPVQTKGKFGALQINTLNIAPNSNWARKHKASMILNYSKAPYFDRYFPFFKSIYDKPPGRFCELVNEINAYLMDSLDIHADIRYSSQMNVDGQKSDLVFNLCRQLGATTYLSGSLGRDYLEVEKFEQSNILVRYHDYEHPVYDQFYKNFESNMSVIDLLFNHGENSSKILNNSKIRDEHLGYQRIGG